MHSGTTRDKPGPDVSLLALTLRTMKISASPLVVAVALGLLGPLALTPDSEDTDPGARESDALRDPVTTPMDVEQDDAE